MATIEIMQESGATEEMIVNKLKIRYGLHDGEIKAYMPKTT